MLGPKVILDYQIHSMNLHGEKQVRFQCSFIPSDGVQERDSTGNVHF